MPTPIIEVEHFSKRFGAAQVVKDLSFEVERGEIFAFLGANGSGKTTTIRTLLGIYEQDEGTLFVDGRPYSPEVASMLGYLPEERGLYATSPVLETLVYFGELKGLRRAEAVKRATNYLERVGLADKAKVNIKKLSGGQQQKVQLGATIINEPELLILDEPTKALDPVNRALLMELLLELNRGGSTIVFITHQMDEVERIAERLVMIQEGERALYGALDEVKAAFSDNNLRVIFAGEFPVEPTLYEVELVKPTKQTGRTQTASITPRPGVEPQRILRNLLQHDLELTAFELDTPSLDDIFLEVSKNHERVQA
ncbi:ATP-binding cassette domain-containing protein [soil metagenome]